MSHTDPSLNPIVPNANAIAAGRDKYPMLKTDQSVGKMRASEAHHVADENNLQGACCAPCRPM
jgi:hypothetical protein